MISSKLQRLQLPCYNCRTLYGLSRFSSTDFAQNVLSLSVIVYQLEGHKMEIRLHASTPTLALLICLHAFCCCFSASLQFQSESTDMTLVVGETMTLTCNFSEPIVEDEYIIWKRGSDIGACYGSRVILCYKVGDVSTHDSRIKFYSRERQWFKLIISNVTISDAGSYECEWYFKDDSNNTRLQTIETMEVLVLPLQVVFEGSPKSTTKTSPITSPHHRPSNTTSHPAIKSSPERSVLTTRSSAKKLALPTKSSSSIKMSPLTTEERKPTPQSTQSITVRTSNSNILSDQTDSKQGQFSLNIPRGGGGHSTFKWSGCAAGGLKPGPCLKPLVARKIYHVLTLTYLGGGALWPPPLSFF